MVTKTWNAPSADLLGLGGADVCTSVSALSAAAAPFQGIGLSAACTDGLVVGRLRVVKPVAERFIAPTYLPTHDGTTLGIHPSGRPQS